MLLSEAILKGCQRTVKVKNKLFDGKNGCCVIGAACVGLHGTFSKAKRHGTAKIVDDTFPTLWNSLWSEAVSRNNNTEESRESIAAWLATKGY